MSVKILCPYCGQRYEVQGYEEGATVECASCGQNIVLTLGLLDTQPDEPLVIKKEEPKPEPPKEEEPTREIAPIEEEPEQPTRKPKKKNPPFLCCVLSSIGVILAIISVFGIIVSILDRNSSGIEIMLGVFFSCLLCFGLSDLVKCIFDIKDNAIKQTELLEKLVNGKQP